MTTIATALPTRPQVIAAEHVYCQKCYDVLGEVVHERGRTLLKIGGHPLIMVEGRCGNCNTDFRWTSSQRALNRLLKHYPKPA